MIRDRLKTQIKVLHRSYRRRGLYKYMGNNLVKIVLIYGIFIVLAYFAGKYVVDMKKIMDVFINSLPDVWVPVLFFVSESFLGLVPVDLFVFWSLKFENSMPYLAMLGVLSYLGGIISYYIGLGLSRRPKIKAYSERRLANYITFVKKWGGAFIVVAALFPFSPFSMVVIALSLLKYPFRWFLILGLTRLVRFVLQGKIFDDILNIDSWML